MKILLIHNRYKQPGGEDAVFQSESDLLLAHGHEVERMEYSNSDMRSFFDKCVSGLLTIYNPKSAHALKVKIRSFHPDVIHVHNFLPLVSPSIFFVANKMHVPVILTLHNYRLICPSATLFFDGKIYEKSIHSIFPLDAIWKGVYRNSKIQTAVVALMTAVHHILGTWKTKVDCYITLTDFAKEKFKNSALSIAESKLFVKPNFVEDCGNGFFLRRDFFLFVGRLTQEKGIETLLKVANTFAFKLVIIGDGPLREMVEDAVKKNSAIHYLGLQPKATIINHLKNCKALVFPSIWYEGFPITILEAFSTGTPVIASNLGCMKEVIKNRMNGLLFNSGDEKGLASKIIEMMQENNLAKKLSENARLSYLERYTPFNNYEYLMQVYYQVIFQKKQLTHEKNYF